MFYDVLEKIMDSHNKTVGGGSASAVAAAMAAGLIAMVARLSLGKGYGLTDERYIQIADELDSYVTPLKNGAVDDTMSFLGIKNAFALPKSTEDEKSARRAAIEKAAVKAADVPLKNGQMARKIYEIWKEMDGKSNPAAGSDFQAGMMLAKMAVIDTALNIEANLSLIKTADINTEYANAAKELKTAVL